MSRSANITVQRTAGLKISIIRFLIGYAAAATTVPYILLKIVWLSGGTLGMNDPEFFRSNGFLIGNAVTLGMDSLAILLALALTRRWGNKLPAAIILFPVWMATGLLAPILVIMLFSPLVFDEVSAQDNPLQSWVFRLVYGGFAAQGGLLIAAFVFYARERWENLRFGQKFAAIPPPESRSQRYLLACGALIAIFLTVFHFCWLLGVQIGLSKGVLELPKAAFYLTLIVHAGFTVASAIGATLMIRSISRGLINLSPLILIWIGAGALFGWGIWEFFIAVGNPAFSSLAASLVSVIKIAAAVLIVAPTAALLLKYNPSNFVREK